MEVRSIESIIERRQAVMSHFMFIARSDTDSERQIEGIEQFYLPNDVINEQIRVEEFIEERNDIFRV